MEESRLQPARLLEKTLHVFNHLIDLLSAAADDLQGLGRGLFVLHGGMS
jgi:hypothetical protein